MKSATARVLDSGMKYWETVADNLKKAGWSWGCVSALDREGRTIWIADAHCGDGQRFFVRADEKLTAFLELQRAISWARSIMSAIPMRGSATPRSSSFLV